jgi:hypothetical protein
MRALPYLLFALTALVGTAAVVVEMRRQGAVDSPTNGTGSADVIFIALVFSAVGMLVARARPRNVVGWIFLVSGLEWAVWGALNDYARAVLVEGAPDVLGAALLFEWIGRWAWIPVAMPAVLFAPMFFPDGRLLSPRWWPLPVIGAASGIASAVGTALIPGEDQLNGLPGVRNPFGIDAPWVGALETVSFIVMVLAVVATVATLVLRMRRGNTVERQQLKVFFFAALLWPLFIGISGASTLTGRWEVPDWVSLLVILSLPVAIGLAILRYRLYDIDLLINRTLVYGALSALLAATYFGAVVLLGALLRPFAAESELAVAGSTLAVVVLFAPLRSRIQRLVDERFYRSKYDAARTLDAFSARLRDQVDLDALEREVLGVVGQTVQPAHAALWLRERAR